MRRQDRRDTQTRQRAASAEGATINEMNNAAHLIEQMVAESLRVKSRFFEENCDRIVETAAKLTQVLKSGHKVLFFGNGGSAADAQHLATELVCRFGPDRAALPGISLS